MPVILSDPSSFCNTMGVESVTTQGVGQSATAHASELMFPQSVQGNQSIQYPFASSNQPVYHNKVYDGAFINNNCRFMNFSFTFIC